LVELFEEIRNALREYADEIIDYKENQDFKEKDWIEHEIYAPKVVRTEEFGTWVRFKPTGTTRKSLNSWLQSTVMKDLLKLPSHDRMIGIVHREIAKETNKDILEFKQSLKVWGKSGSVE